MLEAMKRIETVEALPGYRLRLRFDDGVEGEVGLGDLLDQPIFRSLADPEVFARVTIRKGRALIWPGEVDLCADSLYLRVTGKPVEALFPGLVAEAVHA